MENCELPESWTELSFSEAAQRVRSRGTKIKAGEYKLVGRIPIVDQGQKLVVGFTDDQSAKFQGPLPVIVFGDHTREVKFVDFDFAVGADGTVLLKPVSRIEPRFFYYWLQSATLHHLGYSRHFKLLAEQVVRFPVSLEEQRRIVARVEALTRRLDQASQARQAALVETITCLRSVVAGFFANCDESSFRLLGEVTGIIGGNSIPENAPLPVKGEERIGLIKVSDMNAPGNERFITSCKLETSRAAAVARKLRIVPVGAVVFPKRGGAIATNKKRVLTIPAALDPNTMGVYPLPESGLISDFLFWWFESLDLAELQEDGGIPQINKKHLDSLPIPVLSEAEQRAIVARLDAMRGKLDELQRLQREVAAELASFTPALLAKAFRGEL